MTLVLVSSSWTFENGVVTAFGEEPRARYSCSACGEIGHSTRTCGMTDEQRAISRRGTARCGACNEYGHNVRTCPIADTEMDLRR